MDNPRPGGLVVLQRYVGVSAVLLAVLLASLAQAWAAGPEEPPSYAPGRILVKLRPGAAIRELAGGQDIPHIGVLSVPVTEGRELEEANRLRMNPEVEFAEPNYLVTALNTPNDPYFSFYQWNLRIIRSEAAWDIEVGKNNVTIAVLDTGVDLTHPDLASKVLPGLNMLDQSAPPQDDNGHGSHVAGIAAAASNNGTGIAGVSWGARILPVKVLDSFGMGTVEELARGIIWAADQGARVMNISSGTLSSSQTLEEAVNYAHDTKGSLIAAAVGNDGGFGGFNPPQYP
ncbi:MAG: S8 family serine peptidase, partial [Dehalococcoidia bacterium]|nr:S8 family serine peptidase [Dehalococcoidia bacterium]